MTAEKAVQGFSEYKLVDYLANRLYGGARREGDQVEPHYKKNIETIGFLFNRW